MEECKFKDKCEGDHTTAQHHMTVYERIIKQECSMDAYSCIKEAVDRDARVDILMLAFIGTIMAQTKCSSEVAKARAIELCAITAMKLGRTK